MKKIDPIRSLPEAICAVRVMATTLAAEIGDVRAMSYLRSTLLDRMVPLISLTGNDDDTGCWRLRGLQEIFILVNYQDPEITDAAIERRMNGIRRILLDPTWRLAPEAPARAA